MLLDQNSPSNSSNGSAYFFGLICLKGIECFLMQGKFYELYELDADVGHKELDWKITLSGVGKCRQVFWMNLLTHFRYIVNRLEVRNLLKKGVSLI